MPDIETYLSLVPDWASQLEIVVLEPDEGEIRERLNLQPEHTPLFIVAVLSTPDGQFPPFLDAQFRLEDPDGKSVDPFVGSNLVVVENPARGPWTIVAKGGQVPFAITMMAFHPAIRSNSPPSPGTTASSPFKCRACKISTKGLALALVAAATLPSLPAALLSALATYLGSTILVAAAFASSVIGDTAGIIAEKLCRKVGLCP